MIQTQGLTHIHLMVRDLERSAKFYKEVFGMTELFREGDMVFLNTPGSNDAIALNENRSGVEKAGDCGGIAHFGFRLTNQSDLDSAIVQIERAGGKLLSRGEHAPGINYAYLRDPDGYVIEL
jgi:catechol 2,3-dioxygenase-like lactoylglutathione lyase family enzyme